MTKCDVTHLCVFQYIVMLFVMVAGEIVAGSLSLVYRAEVEGHLEHQMKLQLQNDYGDHDERTRDAWNFLQVEVSALGYFRRNYFFREFTTCV